MRGSGTLNTVRPGQYEKKEQLQKEWPSPRAGPGVRTGLIYARLQIRVRGTRSPNSLAPLSVGLVKNGPECKAPKGEHGRKTVMQSKQSWHFLKAGPFLINLIEKKRVEETNMDLGKSLKPYLEKNNFHQLYGHRIEENKR